MSQVMIRCERLTKNYGSFRAVNEVSFEVPKGQVLGFLGPNGAGKSTTMKILTCYLTPTSGTAQVAGLDVFRQHVEVRRKIGYLPEDTPLYRDMTVIDYLDYVAELRGIGRAKRRDRMREIGRVTGILNVLGKKIGELSKGYRQRVGITQAMLHEPELLILDEPTSGLDPNQIVEIRHLIQEFGKQKTVILSTHNLPEVRATCDRVLIISQGRLVADGRPDDLVAREQSSRFRLLLGAEGLSPAAEVKDKLAKVAGVVEVTESPAATEQLQLLLNTDGQADIRPEVFRLVTDNRWPLLELDRQEASLEEVFARLTKVTPTLVPASPKTPAEEKAA
jgi:ABC-2 type transport system ATP-binding protein